MKFRTMFLALFLGSVAASASMAQVPAGAPVGTTGLCKDGSYSSNATRKGACSRHKGVKDWYATTAAPASAPDVPMLPLTSPIEAAATAAEPDRKAKPVTSAGPAPGDVWVNASGKIYHCPGSKWYGKTRHGSYMSEAVARAAGKRADHGKVCS